MEGHGKIGQWALFRKRSASAQSRDGRPLAKKSATSYNTDEEVQDSDSIAKDINATVRTIYPESDIIKHYFWQATALPRNLPKILARIDENMQATVAHSPDHWIYIRHSIAGSDLFMSSTRTSLRGNMFKRNLDRIVQQTKRDHPEDRITVTVLIYQFEGFHPDNWEQRALVNGLRDDLPRESHPPQDQRGMQEAREVTNLEKRITESKEVVKTWKEKALLGEKETRDLQAKLLMEDMAITTLGDCKLDEAIRQRDKAIWQRDEVVRQRDEAIRHRENTLRKRDQYEKELRNALQEGNLQITRLEKETSATKERQGRAKTAHEVGGLNESLQRREQEIANLQATVQGQNKAIANAKEREEGLRRKLKDLLDEKYAREREDLDRQKREMEQEMERQRQEMERQRQEELESFGPH